MARRVPLHPELKTALTALAREGGAPGPVVVSERCANRATQPDIRHMTAKSIVNWFTGACREAGLVGCSSHSGRRTFVTRAARLVHKAGGSLRDVLTRKTYSEIVEALEPVIIKHYHKLISICIKHIRASHLTLDMLLNRAKTLHDSMRAKHYAHAIWKITQAYSRKLDETNRIDFDSMIANATLLVETGPHRNAIRRSHRSSEIGCRPRSRRATRDNPDVLIPSPPNGR